MLRCQLDMIEVIDPKIEERQWVFYSANPNAIGDTGKVITSCDMMIIEYHDHPLRAIASP